MSDFTQKQVRRLDIITYLSSFEKAVEKLGVIESMSMFVEHYLDESDLKEDLKEMIFDKEEGAHLKNLRDIMVSSFSKVDENSELSKKAWDILDQAIQSFLSLPSIKKEVD